MSRRRITLLTLLVLGFYGLHQDVWNWRRAEPLTFGFLPPGLAYHAVYTLATAVLLLGLVRWAWPRSLDPDPPRGSRSDRGEGAS